MTTTLLVESYRREDGQRMQRLVKRWKVGPLTVWRKNLGEEEVPGYVEISVGAFGDTSGWVSRFAPFDRDGRKPQ